MKLKTIISMMVIGILISTSVYAEEEVDVNIPGFDIVIGGESIDNQHNKYPMIVYNDITYFPMTWNFSRALGLKTDWQNESGLSIGKTRETEKLKQDLSANNDLSKTYKANIADFNIKLNDEALNNSKEEYPILIFRDVTYFPLTWKFTVDEFGWESKYEQSSGLSIVNHEITNNITVDNSMNNSTNISDVNNSNVVVTNNNIDNSMNNSNNVTNNYSTTINNFIDNSITINNMSAASIDDLVAALTGLTAVEKTNSFVVLNASHQPVDGAVLYINNEIKGVSDSGGHLDYQATGSQAYIRIRKTGYQEYNEDLILSDGLTKTINLKQSTTQVTNNYTGAYEDLYPVYAEASRYQMNLKMMGDMFDYETHDISKLEIIDTDTGKNVLDSYMENSWGSVNDVSFYNPIVYIKSSYNNGQGLKPGKTYKLTVRNHNREKSADLLAVLEPIVSLDGRSDVSIIGDYVYVKIRIDSSHKRLFDTPFALVDEDGFVIYQETQMFIKAYEEYLEFELVDADKLKQTRYLFLRPVVEGSVYQPDIAFSKLETIYEPIMLSYDGDLFNRTANEYADDTLFRIYGYNIAGQTYTVDLEYENRTIKQLTATAQKSDDGLMDYVEFKVDYETLEKGRYHINFREFGGFGTFRVD